MAYFYKADADTDPDLQKKWTLYQNSLHDLKNPPRMGIKHYRAVEQLKTWDLRKFESVEKYQNFMELLPSA